jgi:surface protein
MSTTIIDDSNLRNLVQHYIENKAELPDDLKDKLIGSWDVSRVTDMSRLFMGYNDFNESIGDWDVSRVRTMNRMFKDCSIFNQQLNWDVGEVRNMVGMFYGCTTFNQPLKSPDGGDWNVINVRDMLGMFYDCHAFNQPLNWNVANVEKIKNMFVNCRNFNQRLNWNVSNVNNTNMEGVFYGCTNFNKPLKWDVRNVTNMKIMFARCTNFNKLLNWDVRNVINMSYMFQHCTSFNQPINFWNVRNVDSWTDIFDNCPIAQYNKPRFNGEPVVVNPYEIHQATAKINLNKFNEFLSGLTNTTVPEDMNYPDYIYSSIHNLIFNNGNDEAENVKQQQQEGLTRIMEERIGGFDFDNLSAALREAVFYSLEYVKIQPQEFKKIYVDNFIKDCINAYEVQDEDDDGMTCVAGAVERVLLSLVPACVAASGENPNYQKIVDMLMIDKLITIFITNWYKLHNKDKANAFPVGTTRDDRREDLKRSLMEKYPDNEDLIEGKISSIADHIGYEDDDFTYEGGRRRRSRKRGKKSYKKNGKKTRRRTRSRRRR